MDQPVKEATSVNASYPFNEIEAVMKDFKAFVEGVQSASVSDKDMVRLEMNMTDLSCDCALRLADHYLMLKKAFSD